MEFKSDIPIYIQIATDIKEQILNGTLKAGDKLPSIREYSVEYEVSPLTMQRAIQFLDIEEMIYSKKGIGSFVKEGTREELEKKMVEVTIREFILKMRNCGMSDFAILDRVEKSLRDEGRKG